MGGLGGARTKDVRNEVSQQSRNNDIEMLTTLLNVKKMVEIYPPKYAPSEELGDSAISNLKKIAKKVPNLQEFRALFVEQCESRGPPRPNRKVTWCDTRDVLKKLQEMEVEDYSVTKASGKRATAARKKTLKRKVEKTSESEDSEVTTPPPQKKARVQEPSTRNSSSEASGSKKSFDAKMEDVSDTTLTSIKKERQVAPLIGLGITNFSELFDMSRGSQVEPATPSSQAQAIKETSLSPPSPESPYWGDNPPNWFDDELVIVDRSAHNTQGVQQATRYASTSPISPAVTTSSCDGWVHVDSDVSEGYEDKISPTSPVSSSPVSPASAISPGVSAWIRDGWVKAERYTYYESDEDFKTSPTSPVFSASPTSPTTTISSIESTSTSILSPSIAKGQPNPLAPTLPFIPSPSIKSQQPNPSMAYQILAAFTASATLMSTALDTLPKEGDANYNKLINEELRNAVEATKAVLRVQRDTIMDTFNRV